MMMYLLGRLPHTGDHAAWADWKLEVVDMDGKRIDKVLAMRQIQSGPQPQQEKA